MAALKTCCAPKPFAGCFVVAWPSLSAFGADVGAAAARAAAAGTAGGPAAAGAAAAGAAPALGVAAGDDAVAAGVTWGPLPSLAARRATLRPDLAGCGVALGFVSESPRGVRELLLRVSLPLSDPADPSPRELLVSECASSARTFLGVSLGVSLPRAAPAVDTSAAPAVDTSPPRGEGWAGVGAVAGHKVLEVSLCDPICSGGGGEGEEAGRASPLPVVG